MKQCKDCKGWLPEDDDNFYRVDNGCRLAAYCKRCHRRRASMSVAKRREERKADGLPLNPYRAPKEHNDRYLERHLQRREKEAELEESLERVERGQQSNAGGMSFADIKFHSLNPEPVFRGLTNYFLRPQTKVSHWRTV